MLRPSAWLLFVLWLVLLNLGCGGKKLEPILVPEQMPIRVEVYPRVLLSSGSARVSCWAPEGTRLIRFGIEGLSMSEVELPSLRTSRLVERIPSGIWAVTCTDGRTRSEVQLEVQ